MDEMTVTTRIEAFLARIVNGSGEIPEPETDTELYLAAICGESVTLPEPDSRFTTFLARILGENVALPVPQTRAEMYLAKICGEDVTVPVPLTRLDAWLALWAESGGGTETTVTGVAPIVMAAALAHHILSLTQFGKCEQRNLPQEYSELEYIEGDGAAYIDLGFKLTQDDDVEVDFALTTSQASKYIFGNRGSDASANNIALFFASTANKVVADFNNSDYSLYRAGPSDALTTGVMYSAVLNKNKRGIYNGATTIVENTTACADTIETAGNAAIFSGYYPNGAFYTGNNFSGRIYRVTIAGKHDLRPAKNSSDVVGMYDLVTGQFFTNAGEGSFTAGSVSVPTPAAPMDIVCNNGALKFGKPMTVDSTRYSAYVNASGTWQYAADSYSVVVPVVIGKKYKIAFDETGQQSSIGGVQNTIFRYGFTDDTDVYDQTIQLTSWGRSTPQDTPYVELTADNPYLIIQTGAAISQTLWSNGYIGVKLQEVYANGTPETLWISPNYGQTFTLSDDIPNYSGDDTHRAGTILSNLPAGKYTLKYGNAGGRALFVYYYDGGVKSSSYKSIGTGVEITLERGGSFYLYSGGGVTVEQIASLTLEVYNTTLQTVTDVPMLLSVGDYADEAELISGIKTGKVGVMVLDGTENWRTSISTKFFLDNTVMRNYNNMPVLCSHYEAVLAAGSSGVGNNQIGLFASATQGASNARLVICDPRYTATADFQAYLAAQYAAGTPVIVVYPLATETTEQGTAHALNTAQGTNTASVSSNVDPVTLSCRYMAAA